MKKIVFETIEKLCEKNKISICKLEQETGIGNGTIGRWKKSSPRIDLAKKVADYFGCTIDELLKED